MGPYNKWTSENELFLSKFDCFCNLYYSYYKVLALKNDFVSQWEQSLQPNRVYPVHGGLENGFYLKFLILNYLLRVYNTIQIYVQCVPGKSGLTQKYTFIKKSTIFI